MAEVQYTLHLVLYATTLLMAMELNEDLHSNAALEDTMEDY